VERLFVEKKGMLQQSVIAESLCGDTAVGHSIAWAGLAESLAGFQADSQLQAERTIALELERIAMHLADTAALCTDVAYQFGQVVTEALRTIVINTTQLWCGNRFGKGLVRPGGTNYPLSETLVTEILANLESVEERYLQVTSRIFSLPSVLGRFEGTGIVTTMQASLIGTVGMAARSSGMFRDIRWSHPFSSYIDHPIDPVVLTKGDVWSRAMLRKMEVEQSLTVIRTLLKQISNSGFRMSSNQIRPGYDLTFAPLSLGISLVEGWRGEICHIAVTDETGALVHYKAKDPSLHNWMALAMAVRNQEISDFPLCNKSFNLSYCGNDL
jgi:Ni,Fe-hydrogenase III large subunit